MIIRIDTILSRILKYRKTIENHSLYHDLHCRTNVFYFAIHLPPVEEGEFLLYILLNTLWLDMLYGKGFLAILPMRIVKNLIMWPTDYIYLENIIILVIYKIKNANIPVLNKPLIFAFLIILTT